MRERRCQFEASCDHDVVIMRISSLVGNSNCDVIAGGRVDPVTARSVYDRYLREAATADWLIVVLALLCLWAVLI